MCRAVQEPACSWESKESPFLEVTTEAESAYFNCNSNHSQISTESKVLGKFSSPLSVSVYSIFPGSPPSSLVDRKSKHHAVLGSFVRVSCIPTQYS